MIDRRTFLAGSAGALALPRLRRPRRQVPIRSLTRGPRHHWFGYYDKHQFDADDRLVLGMQVGFQHRTPKADDEIRLGVVDLEDNDRWTELGTTKAWGWQQGCMLQWRPGADREVLYNDRVDGAFVTRAVDVERGTTRTLPHPFYTVSPDGRTALGLDFARLQRLRPGYGYAGVPDETARDRIPDRAGIYRLDLDSGERTELFTVRELVEQTDPDGELASAQHYVNHLLVSPDGSRFIFLHRWRPKTQRFGFRTRMYTAKVDDGSELHRLDGSGHTSHFIWRDPRHVLAWSKQAAGRGFYLFTDRSDDVAAVGRAAMPHDGHCTYLPVGDGTEWILNDSYPKGEAREQQLYLYHVPSARRVDLAALHAPPTFRGEWRCDLHPRSNHAGSHVAVDSPHRDGSRQMYLLDIREVLE